MAKFIITGFADEAAGDIQGQIAALKRNNMGYIEVRNINGKCAIDYTEDEIKEFAKTFEEAGIKVSSVGSPIGKYNITDDFEPHFERFKKAVKAAQIFGAKYIRMFSFFIPDGEKATDYREEVMARLNALVEYAEKEGVQLCHENEAKIYGCLPAEVKDILENVKGIRGIFDPANYIMDDADITWAVDNTKQYIEYLHIKDACLDGHIIVPAGFGDGKIAEVITKISEVKDDETFASIEPHLYAFTGYSNLDTRELKHKFKFENQNESFDAAVNAFKEILKNLGYVEGEDKVWKK